MSAVTHYKKPRERKRGPPPIDQEMTHYNNAPGHVRRRMATSFELAVLIETCGCHGKLVCPNRREAQ